MSSVTDIRFRDLAQREKDARSALKLEQRRLEETKKKRNLTDDEYVDLTRIDEVLSQKKELLVDPMFVGVRDAFNGTTGFLNKILLDHADGVLRAGPLPAGETKDGVPYSKDAAATATRNAATIAEADVVNVAHVLGLLALDGVVPPQVIKLSARNSAESAIGSDINDPRYEDFTTAFYTALGSARGSRALAALVLPILQAEGDRDGSQKGSPGEVETREFAAVMRCLREKGVTPNEPGQLRRKVNECLDTLQSVGVNGAVSDLSIDLPDFNAITDYQIQKENVEAIGPMICAAMFDELKAFDVVDKLVEQSQNGMLPIGVSGAGTMLYAYWKDTPNRMSESERRNFYSLTMGIPGGPANAAANRDFNDLWIRFVSSVSSVVRQSTTDQLLRATIPAGINQQQVRKAARDLALNLSAHGYGMVNCAARDLQDQIAKMIKLLGHPDIMSAYGARDMWQVIDQVTTLELGGARNSARYRTLATCGAIITKWLSQNIKRFNTTTSLQKVIDVELVLSSDPPSAGVNATRQPTDYDLVNACELWLADTAVGDDRIEQLSQPRESPAMTSKPVAIPAVARELLDQALPPGLGLGMSATRH
jgi:hypothetical protein